MSFNWRDLQFRPALVWLLPEVLHRVGGIVMFLWSFENGLQQKQSSFAIVPAIQSSSLKLPTSSLLLSKSSCDFPGLSASPSWGLNLLLQIFFLISSPVPKYIIFTSEGGLAESTVSDTYIRMSMAWVGVIVYSLFASASMIFK